MHAPAPVDLYRVVLFLVVLGAFHLAAQAVSASRRSKGASFALLNLAILWWAVAKLVQISTASASVAFVAYHAAYVGVCAVAPALLEYSRAAGAAGPRRTHPLAPWIVPSLLLGLILTNPLHFLFWSAYPATAGPVFHPERGIGYWLNAAYSWGLSGWSIVRFVREALRSRGARRVWFLHATAAILLPFAVNLAYIAAGTSMELDPTPAVFSLALLALALSNSVYDPVQRIPFPKDAVFDALGLPVWLVDGDRAVVARNRIAAERFGEDVAPAGSRFEAPFGGFADALDRGSSLVRSGPRIFRLETCHLAPGSGRRSSDGWLVTASDVTELEAERIRADDANRAKSAFLASMSHELRTPLNAVIGLVELTLRSCLDPVQRRDLELAVEASKRLLSLINEVLDLSKIESGRLTLEAIDFDPVGQAERLVLSMRPLAERKGLSLAFSASDRVPRAALGDPLRFSEIILNLVGNAIKFTERGGVSVTLDPAKAEDDPRQVALEVTVADTGIGIAPDRIATVFDDFSQAGTDTARKYGGTGLGLGIARRLARLMGGDVTASSRPGEGSTFRFECRLPVGDPDRIAPEDGGAAEEGSPLLSLTPLSVLLVEDDDLNALVAVRILGQLGHRVDRAANGAEALERLRAGGYVLAFVDIELPDLDGIELARRVRSGEAGYPQLPLVAMSAHLASELGDRLAEAAFDDFITKPLSQASLEGTLARFAGTTEALTRAAAEFDRRRCAAEGRVLDLREALARLGGDSDLLAELTRIFRADAEAKRDELAAALAAGDAEALRRLAHATRSGARTLGALAVDAAAARLEEAAATGRRTELGRLVGELDAARVATLDALDGELAALVDAAGPAAADGECD